MVFVTKVPENPSSLAGDCQIAEIVQYTCEIGSNGGMNCFPIPRIFRLSVITTLILLTPLTGITAAPVDQPLKSRGR